jgi:hypothetical protein
MTDLELIFTMLGEASTTEIARRKDAQGFPANRRTAKEGGKIAGDARKALEAKTGKPVVSASNNMALAGSSTDQAPSAFVETQTKTLPTKSKSKTATLKGKPRKQRSR